MINHKYKCIFIHIPRCAGTSIEVAINGKPNNGSNFSFKHLTASYAKILYKDYWNDYFKFSIVRNPWSRMVSMCKFPFYGCKIMNGKLSVNEYMQKWPAIEIDPRTNCNIKDHGVIYDNCVYKNLLSDDLDFVGRFENLEESYIFVKQAIGLDLKNFPCHPNQSSRKKHYTEYYDDETREIVAKKYAKDIEYFGYKFDK